MRSGFYGHLQDSEQMQHRRQIGISNIVPFIDSQRRDRIFSSKLEMLVEELNESRHVLNICELESGMLASSLTYYIPFVTIYV